MRVNQEPIFHISIGSVPYSPSSAPPDDSVQTLSLEAVSEDSEDEESAYSHFGSAPSIRRVLHVVECTVGHRIFRYSLRGRSLTEDSVQGNRRFVES